jgi:membrane protein implicated in regulation of membrane protease activity
VRIWFYGWVLAAALIALVATAMRDRYTAPWAAGAAAAAGLEALRAPLEWQWGAFFVISAALFIAFNGVRRSPGRHARRSSKRRRR